MSDHVTSGRSRPTITVLVGNERSLPRAALVDLLSTAADFRVVGEASSAAELMQDLVRTGADVVVVDGQLCDETVVRSLLTAQPSLRIVVLASLVTADRMLAILQAGAAAYLHDDIGRADLISALRSATRPLVRHTPDIVFVAVDRSTFRGLTRAEELLTQREFAVLELLADAKSTREIARDLNLSDGTVKRNLSRVYHKLGATSRMEAVQKASKEGLLQRTDRRPRAGLA